MPRFTITAMDRLDPAGVPPHPSTSYRFTIVRSSSGSDVRLEGHAVHTRSTLLAAIARLSIPTVEALVGRRFLSESGDIESAFIDFLLYGGDGSPEPTPRPQELLANARELLTRVAESLAALRCPDWSGEDPDLIHFAFAGAFDTEGSLSERWFTALVTKVERCSGGTVRLDLGDPVEFVSWPPPPFACLILSQGDERHWLILRPGPQPIVTDEAASRERAPVATTPHPQAPTTIEERTWNECVIDLPELDGVADLLDAGAPPAHGSALASLPSSAADVTGAIARGDGELTFAHERITQLIGLVNDRDQRELLSAALTHVQAIQHELATIGAQLRARHRGS